MSTCERREDEKQFGERTRPPRAELLDRQPGKNLGTPERIANIVACLLSSDGVWINAQLIRADGGFSA